MKRAGWHLSPLRSIRSKIFIAFSLVALLSLAAVTSIIYYHSFNTIKKNAIIYITDIIRHADESLKLMLIDMDNINTVIVSSRANVIDPLMSEHYPISYEWFLENKQVEDFLASFITYKSYINRISVIGLNGKFYRAGAPLTDQFVAESRGLVQQIIDSSSQRVFMQRTKGGDNDAVIVGRAIRYSGKTIGASIIEINYDIVKQVYHIKPLDDSYVYVIEDNGDFVYKSNSELMANNISETNFEQVLSADAGKETMSEVDYEGNSYLVVNYKSDFTGWLTIGMIKNTSLLKDSLRLRTQIVEVSAIVFLIVILLSNVLAAQITKNLNKLRNAMRTVRDGKLNSVTSIQTQDEVGQLSVVFNSMIERLKYLLDDISIKERQKRELEFTALQAQISPHFLYNTLNTIRYMAQLQNSRNIEEITGSLIDLLRGIVGNSHPFVTLGEELDYVKSYITIQSYKYMDRFQVIYQTDPELMDCMTIKMVLQPIVENAIFHGVQSLPYNGIIVIKMYREGDLVIIEVTDNGVGMTEEQIQQLLRAQGGERTTSFSGIGISNVHERLQLYFGSAYGLKVESEPQLYTKVQICMPHIGRGEAGVNQSTASG
ncbi:two-component system, sensor histidine kinase YesM [Paenibacillus sp. 1_12]|uniref:sensor histidine kinase n=1 Tax=Paenibacillus sp. 1_12 TaxID=1566278 RepID=UPI0008EB025C|nr:sensor histidine kinase [Paenibacillus sp. 1_12]SFK98935.1 two-component system, sensor histidine kinase YesM [Paenibacillus sp. 1_12]